MSEYYVILLEYVWIYNNRWGSEYVSYNIWQEGTLQFNEYLLRDRHMECFGKVIIAF